MYSRTRCRARGGRPPRNRGCNCANTGSADLPFPPPTASSRAGCDAYGTLAELVETGMAMTCSEAVSIRLARVEGRADACEQVFVIEWLGQVANHTGLLRTSAVPLIGKRGNQNGRNGIARPNQAMVKLEPAHPRHPHVCDKAGRPVKLLGFQK